MSKVETVEKYFRQAVHDTATRLSECASELEAVAAEIREARLAVEQATEACNRAEIASTTRALGDLELQKSALELRREQLEDQLAAQISSEKHKAGNVAERYERERKEQGKIAMREHVENALASLEQAVAAFEEIAGMPRCEILANHEVSALTVHLPQSKKSPMWQFYLVDSYRRITPPGELEKALEFLKKL